MEIARINKSRVRLHCKNIFTVLLQFKIERILKPDK